MTTSPYRTAPRAKEVERIVLKRTRMRSLLFCLPFLVSLRTHFISTINEPEVPGVFIDEHGWLVVVVQRMVAAAGIPSRSTFTAEYVAPITLRQTVVHDMTPVRIFFGIIALGGIAKYVRDRRRGKRTEVIIDRHARAISVMTRGVTYNVDLHDRPLLVMRDDDVFLHAGKATPILLAHADDCSASQVERLRRAMVSLD